MATSDNYFNSLPNSFTAATVIGANKLPVSAFYFTATKDGKPYTGVGPEAYNLPPGAITLPGASNSKPAWKFITAPEDVSWDVSNQSSRVDIFGTNNPPVVAGSRGMRDLTLGNSLVEGFVRGVTVEGKIAALEKLMNYTLNSDDGFVGVPVYQVTANSKVYGNGYFIIKDVKVKETMRDLKGNATRAYVDISLMEVPAYQVSTGRDLASKPAAKARAALISELDPNGVGTTKPTSGPGTGSKATTTKPATQTSTPNTGGSKPSGSGSPRLPGQEIEYRPRPREGQP